MSDDLQLILGGEIPTQPDKQVTESITILDEEKEPVRTPNAVLEEYTSIGTAEKSIDEEIEKFKEEHIEIFNELQDILDRKALITQRKEEIREELATSMETANIKGISNNYYKVTFVAKTQKSTFDRKGFEAKYPVLCKQFLKYSDVKAYVKITEVN